MPPRVQGDVALIRYTIALAGQGTRPDADPLDRRLEQMVRGWAPAVEAALSDRVGASRAAIRLSPWSTYQDMRMEDPVPQFTYLVKELARRHPDLAYLHVITPGVPGSVGPKDETVRVSPSLGFWMWIC